MLKIKKKQDAYAETPNVQTGAENYEEKSNVKKQPFLPFSKQKEDKNVNNNFKLPTINFLAKNPDLENRKNLDASDLSKNSEFLEKILLDFGVEGKIKRISHGPWSH